MRSRLHALSVLLVVSPAASPLAAQELLKPFTAESTVNDFALQCQHPIKKSYGPHRIALCVTYINSAVQQIALAKRSPKCWAELEAGNAAPGPIMDVLFHIAGEPEQGRRQLASELRSVVVDVAAKACR